MRNPITAASFCVLLTYGSTLWSQETPAKPLSEHTYTAGEAFGVAVHLKSAAKISERVIASYHLDASPKESTSTATKPTEHTDFSCMGYVALNQMNFTVNCSTDRQNAGGQYTSDGILTLQRQENGDMIHMPSPTRFPIVTIKAHPYEDLDLPDVASTTLVFSAQQALDDASQKSDKLLQSLNAHFTGQIKDTKETRAYLSEIAERERRIISDARISYQTASSQQQTSPPLVVFQDFDRRLRKVLNDLSRSPEPLSLLSVTPHIILASAQIPTVHDSVTAKTQSSKISKSATDLAGILVDAVKGFLGMKNSGMIVFTWSLTTAPKGANVYVSRLDEPETQLAGTTDMIDKKLDYARWTFRIEWAGCSKFQDVNPFLQSDINMTFPKAGCKAK